MNKEGVRNAFESVCAPPDGVYFDDDDQRYYPLSFASFEINEFCGMWLGWQARQPEIDQLKEDNERLFNVIKQAQVLAGGSERDNAHDMDQQLCEIWLLCDKCDQGEK